MKRIISSLIAILFFISLFICSKKLNAQTGWFMQNSGTSVVLRGVSFINSQTGWAVGWSSSILKTTNGGISWSPQNSGTSQDFKSVQFVNENTGWAVGGHQGAYINIIVNTTNGGQNWFTQYYSTSIGVAHELFFINSNTGWVACSGNNGKVLKTMNGGQNWTELYTGVNINITSCFFLDQNVGWVIGDNGAIFKTTNGGNSWITQNSNTTQGLLGLFILNSNTGHITGHNGTYLKTTNGGQNWISKVSGSTQRMSTIYFVDVNTGWMIGGSFPGGNTHVLKTTNAGDNWVFQSIPTTAWLGDIMFVNSNTGWAVGNYGTIIKTTTGGDTIHQPPITPVLISPANGSQVTTTPLLDWSDVVSATSFRLQVSEVANFMTTVIDQISLAQSQYQVPTGILSANEQYYWRARARNAGGWSPWASAWNFTTSLIGINPISGEIPTSFNLYQNYPNPFNPKTNIKFDIPKTSKIKIIIYDNLGKVIEELVNKKLSAGSYEVEWNALNNPSGIYFSKIVTEDFLDIKKMVLIK